MKKMASVGAQNRLKAARPEVSLLLHDIRSIHNVGSIFRTADAFGVAKIYVSGYTPAPIDRFGRKRADLAKVSLGAEESVVWERVDGAGDPARFIKKFKKENEVKIIALEQDERAVDYREACRDISDDAKIRILLVLGSEVGGISQDIRGLADIIAEIPMHGAKESLNVSVAAGIALFGMFG